jgi:hypothetical protein
MKEMRAKSCLGRYVSKGSCLGIQEEKRSKDVEPELMQAQVDVRLVPIMAVLYLLSHIDRANIGKRKSRAWTKISASQGINSISQLPSSSSHTLYSVCLRNGSGCFEILNTIKLMIHLRNTIKYGLKTGSSQHLAILPRPRLGYNHDLYGCRSKFPRPCCMSCDSWAL